ncbi:MAG: protein BatD [Haliea sp.]|nr:protein BatD [Haliea sp.]
MMTSIGKRLSAVVLLLLALSANIALGAVTATVDRNRVTLGDTLRLTITATDDEDISDSELRALQGDFDILQRSSSSNTSIINGRVSQSQQVTVELAPRREGNLQIPAMRFGQSATPGITVVVGPPSDSPSDGQSVVFEAEVDRSEVYVQGQVILTLRVQQAVSLNERSISPLKLDNAFVKPLEQHSFQRVIDGRPWLVDEVRYAIFPEQSGTLEIPAQVFSGRLDTGRRSFFDLGGGGRMVRRNTQAITINVLPIPATYPTADWLPAQNLTLAETWSTPPEQLRVGESATRTVRIVGTGLQGAQLPPILFTPIDGLKYYPDQPAISEQEVDSGLEGIREDSAAVVPTRAGTYTIPEIRIPWWDTRTGELQYAVLPERTITATGSDPAHAGTPEPLGAPENAQSLPGPASAIDLTATTALPGSPALEGELRMWQAVGAGSTLGWLLTLLYLWRRRGPKTTVASEAAHTVAEKGAFKALLMACGDGNAAGARAAVITWAATIVPGAAPVSLEQVAQRLGDEDFRRQLEELNAALYRPGNSIWSGTTLAECARRVRAGHVGVRTSNREQPIQLYPSTV